MKKTVLLIAFITTVATLGTVVNSRYETTTDVATQGPRISANGTPIPTAIGDETQGRALKIGFFTPPPSYLHIIHDMGSYHFDQGKNLYDENSGIAREDYQWIAKAFNTTVIGYPGPGINDIPARSAIKAAVDNNVFVIIAGGHFDYIAQKIEENPYRDHIIGFRVYDEFVPANCEKRRYPASYPGLGPACTLAEFIAEGQQILQDIHTKVRKYSDVPLILDFIPVELTYSHDDPAKWAADRPGNSNAALIGYLQSCTIDHLFLALQADNTTGGLSISQKVQKAKELFSEITCTDGRKKHISIGLRNGGGGFDTERFDQTPKNQQDLIINLTREIAQQAVSGGAYSVDLYPWRHTTSSLDRKTLDLVPCPGSSDPNCRTAAANPYFESLVATYQKIQEMRRDEQPTPEPHSIMPKSIKCLFSTCPSTP